MSALALYSFYRFIKSTKHLYHTIFKSITIEASYSSGTADPRPEKIEAKLDNSVDKYKDFLRKSRSPTWSNVAIWGGALSC